MSIQIPVGSHPLRVRFDFLPAQSLSIGAPKRIGFTLHWLGATVNSGGIAAFKAAMDAAIGPAFLAAACIKLPAPKITIRDLTNYFLPDNFFAIAVNGAWGPGAIAGDSLPWAAAAGFEKQSNNSGKINRGVLNVPGIPEDGQQEGILTVAQVALYDALGTALATPIVATGVNYVPQIFSTTLSNLKLGLTGVWMQPIVVFDLDEVVTGLKRRKPKAVYQ